MERWSYANWWLNWEGWSWCWRGGQHTVSSTLMSLVCCLPFICYYSSQSPVLGRGWDGLVKVLHYITANTQPALLFFWLHCTTNFRPSEKQLWVKVIFYGACCPPNKPPAIVWQNRVSGRKSKIQEMKGQPAHRPTGKWKCVPIDQTDCWLIKQSRKQRNVKRLIHDKWHKDFLVHSASGCNVL